MDLPGAGSARHEPVPTTVAATAEIVASRIASSAQRTGPLGVLGLSFGGMVALELCRIAPAVFSHAVVINTSSRLSPLWLRLRREGLVLVASGLLLKDPLERELRIYDLTLNDLRAKSGEYATAAAVYQSQRPATRSLVLKQLLAASRFKPGDVAQPVLVLSSKGDRLASPSCSTDLTTFLGAVHVEHPSAGHDLPLDAPRWVLEQLSAWLQSPQAMK